MCKVEKKRAMVREKPDREVLESISWTSEEDST
jgi:hypothetical protein